MELFQKENPLKKKHNGKIYKTEFKEAERIEKRKFTITDLHMLCVMYTYIKKQSLYG